MKFILVVWVGGIIKEMLGVCDFDIMVVKGGR